MIKSTKGLLVYMSTTVGVDVVPTAITSAKPAVVTVADTSGMTDGQPVKMTDTGFPELDDKIFIVDGITGTDFTLLGSDTAASTGSLAASPVATYYDQDTDMQALCLSAISVNPETSTPVSVATFCDVTAQVQGIEPGAGTIDLNLYNDIEDSGYQALLDAEAANDLRVFQIVFPDNGSLVFEGIVSGVNFSDIPLDGSAALVANITLSTKAAHRF